MFIFFFFFFFKRGSFILFFFFFSSRRRHTRSLCDWSSTCALPICGGLFEVGHAFIPDPPPQESRDAALRFRMTGELGSSVEDGSRFMGVREEARVCVVLAGIVRPAGWNLPELRAGFFEVKGVAERIAPGATFEPEARRFLHPGRSAAVLVGGRKAGWLGELHPDVAEEFRLEGWPVAVFELD